MKNSTILTLNFLFWINFIYAQGFTIGPFQGFGMSDQVAADFNGDGYVDVFGIKYSFSGTSKMVMQLSKGTKPIAFSEKIITPNFSVAGAPVAVDFDADKDMDVVITKGSAKHLFVMKNDGMANFTLDSLGVAGVSEIKVADLDQDKDLDIVGITPNSTDFAVFVNNGNQKFTKIVIPTTITGLATFDIGDMDNDKDIDIVLGYSKFFDEHIVLYTNNGSNTFSAKNIAFDSFKNLSELRIDDLNNDGRKDIVAVANFECAAFLSNESFQFSKKSLFSSSDIMRSFAVGDYNGDSKKDIVIGYNSVDITWHKNLSNVDLTFTQFKVGGVTPVYSVINADLDNDKDQDLIVSNGEFWWYENGIIQEPSNTYSAFDEHIVIMPNPFQDRVQIKGITQFPCRLQISDINGKIIQNFTINSDLLDLNNLSPGFYLFQLFNDIEYKYQVFPMIKTE